MIANNVLSRSFAEKIYISSMKLQKIMYFVASEYQKVMKSDLLEESFSTWAYGPVVYSVYDEFRSYGKNGIKRYARDARGKTLIIDEAQDIELKVALDRVWDKAKHKTGIELSKITHIKDSAWDKAFQRDWPVLNPADIGSDTTYREPLGLR
ncbi:putative phage-associated protein [Arcanobacterium pluranimalium]|uniref:Panacea domain-containing protein n=1 Tax=Arcanobacterium pluranimalium TaxID=108028 RepID=UPI00195A195E|nr:type II toxin-antitoxin system antitoxin SocA domain-containing protein [Arcanobacterium pluranimalium]MBM7824576.1 putative phage-associated protein [Arcanobacterium pluranimalium]